ncbi:MAG: twin-arginine translocase subunit TatC [Endozoicomonadaceae bacterium]|nr:twin-arginine translocase subunit TatC [Endozoicomonadaceae bacterium]MBE8232519.1 twin-arginine translocase subunit TatC [Endozoicomonadaceae bacterium]
MNQNKHPVLLQIAELRKCLLRSVFVMMLVFFALIPFSNVWYCLLADPLQSLLPDSVNMIATEVASPFWVPFKLTFFLTILVTLPFWLYQLWIFLVPGLYSREKKLIFPVLFLSVILFVMGMLFAYFVVFPILFQFFIQAAPDNIQVMTDISQYLDFVLALFFAFGVAFETPILTVLLIKTQVLTLEALKQQRPYVILGCFIIGMLLTPPDVFSQTLLAVPMWILFEIGLWIAGFLEKRTMRRKQ